MATESAAIQQRVEGFCLVLPVESIDQVPVFLRQPTEGCRGGSTCISQESEEFHRMALALEGNLARFEGRKRARGRSRGLRDQNRGADRLAARLDPS
ncbi:MAG TPA: hypothetical protein VGU24_13575, partial [Microvirga sp.]|nr:hypothetical protein [Microvirga sp.]